jgi:hypothetical protein
MPVPDDYDLPEATEDSDGEEFTVFSPNRPSKRDIPISGNDQSTDFELEIEEPDIDLATRATNGLFTRLFGVISCYQDRSVNRRYL